MIGSEVIIIGGGPAGASCAWALRQNGVQVVILEKESFRKTKPCAGWITPNVLKRLGIRPQDYPYGILTMNRLALHLFGMRFLIPTRQYSIRRNEFDSWLLDRTGVPVYTHRACRIRKEAGSFIIDDAFTCRYLVGAGGTYCPVFTSFFKTKRPRPADALILTLEQELVHKADNAPGALWFFERGLPGYSWYVPKKGGYLNVGIGGKYSRLRQKKHSIREHWNAFTEKLKRLSVEVGPESGPRGYAYYIRQDSGPVQWENAYLIGDSAGLATTDMGEGIGPAVQSGILAAGAITARRPYTLESIGRFSLKDILLPARC